jgi:hypothetical protein
VPFDPLCWLPLVLDGSGCRRPWPWGSSIQISSKVGPPPPGHKIVHQSSGLLCGIRGTIAHKPYRDRRITACLSYTEVPFEYARAGAHTGGTELNQAPTSR